MVIPSRHFRKILLKIRRSGKTHLVTTLTEVIDLLAAHDQRALFVLSKRWRDHVLQGSMEGIRELHLDQDDLLLYSVNEQHGLIKLLDIVSHEQLRKKR